MPFITEALWLQLPVTHGTQRDESLVVSHWPAADFADAAAEVRMTALMELIETVRTLRSEYNVPPGALVQIRLSNVSAALTEALRAEDRALRRLARVDNVVTNGGGDGGMGAHAVLRGGAELFVPLADVIDVEQERQRLGKELDRLDNQLRGTEARLGSEQFTGRAPADIVTKEREKAASLRDQRDRLAAKLQGLG